MIWGGEMRTAVMLPHPEYAKIYPTPKHRKITVGILKQLSEEYDIDIDIVCLLHAATRMRNSQSPTGTARRGRPVIRTDLLRRTATRRSKRSLTHK